MFSHLREGHRNFVEGRQASWAVSAIYSRIQCIHEGEQPTVSNKVAFLEVENDNIVLEHRADMSFYQTHRALSE